MKVSINIATYPARFESLLKTLDTLKGQADIIRIYLNEYTEIPKELSQYYCVMGENLTDNGKFFWLNNATREYYFSCDDDLLYPANYVKDTLQRMGDSPIVTYHGRIINKPNKDYYGGYRCYNCLRTVEQDLTIDVGGTGVMCINTNKFKCDIAFSEHKKMSDCVLSYAAALQRVPIKLLSHKQGYFGYTPQSQSIFDEQHKKPIQQNIYANKIYELKSLKRFS